MKKLLFVPCLLMVLLIAPVAMADILTVDRVAGYYSGSGGEFTLSGDDLAGVQASYADIVKDVGMWDPSIQSFCVERNEYVSMGSTYNFNLNTAAVAGGIGGATPDGDPLSIGAAYLYYYFSQGTLAGYNYTLGDDRITAAGLLQNAIWWLEEEGIAYDPDNPFMKTVFDMFGGQDGARADNNKYPVLVLNLTTRDGSLAQDMLVTVPEPASMLLLGSGLIGLAGYGRKKFFKK